MVRQKKTSRQCKGVTGTVFPKETNSRQNRDKGRKGRGRWRRAEVSMIDGFNDR